MAQKPQEAKDKTGTQTQSQGMQQTQPSQQTGSQQQSQSMTRGGSSPQQRGLSRQERFAPQSPFTFMRRFSEEMDRLFDDFGFGGSLLSPRSSFGSSLLSPGWGRDIEHSMWSPQIDVSQRGNDLVIHADLPGLTKDDINVDIEDNQIILRGERRDEHEQNEQGIYHSERSYGSFYRAIPLPQGVNPEQANATFQNGVLEITVPMPAQQSRGRKLEISEGGTSRQTGGEQNKTAKQ